MNPSSRDKFCIECKHCVRDVLVPSVLDPSLSIQKHAHIIYNCTHPTIGKNPVTGEIRKGTALFERSLSGKCGPNALLHEPIPESNL